MKKKLNFYEYNQNNSGGSFTVNKELAHRVFIEAENRERADEIAFGLGIYFNGVNDGVDCRCCGDRWNTPDELVFPYRYGTFTKERAEKIVKKYKVGVKKTTWKFVGTGETDPYQYDLVFNDVESYAKYLKDEYGSTEPDFIIHYSK